MTEVRGAVALVTGAGGGIGAAIADELAARGAVVVRTDRRGAPVDLDVTDRAAVRACVTAVVEEHGRLDIAVTAAGLGSACRLDTLADSEWEEMVAVNVWGTVHVVREVYPRLVERRRGHLLLVASLAGLTPSPLLAAYGMTKSAIVGLARSLRIEAAQHGVGVTALCPGPVDTAMLEGGGGRVDVRRLLTDAAGPALAPARVGRAAVRGVEHDRAIVAPGRARLLAFGTRLSPSTADWILRRSMTRELARSGH